MAYDAEHFTITEVPSPITQERQNMLRLRNLIATQPARMFNYVESFPKEFTGNIAKLEIHDCKTPMCILGWARAIARTDDELAVYAGLGLSLDEGQELCFATTNIPYLSITRDMAVTVLDHYLATSLIDWSVAQ